MFDKSYPFNYKNHTVITKSELEFKEHKLTFRCRFNHQYIVNVEEYLLEKYEHQIFVIKFHLKAHSDSENKYNLLTGNRDAARLIRTCLNIMLDFHKDYPSASFGFIGANMLNEERKETKRFRIYRQVMENFFSPIKFEHKVYKKESAYLLLNRKVAKGTLIDIERFFIANYDL